MVVLEQAKRSVAANKVQLDQLRPVSRDALRSLEHLYDLELTYTSNAIEGNTLTALETTLVIEKGITVGGKPLRDHMEAIDHYDAIRFVRELARQDTALTAATVRELHSLVVQRSRPELAGRYAQLPRYVLTDEGQRHHFPSPAEVPALMGDFGAVLRAAENTPDNAFALHRELVTIHPFDDGNGRTARLLMNLLLLRGGYPPVAIRPKDRLAYLRALQAAQSGSGTEAFERLMYERLDTTLDEHLRALREARPTQQ